MNIPLQKVSRYITPLLLLAAMLTAVFLRCWKLEEESLWWDEYATHVHLSEENFSRAFTLIRTLDPLILPLYPFLEYQWARWISPGVLSLRMLSIGIGLITLLALYGLGKKLFDRKTGLLAVWLLALSPVHIHHSQGIRMYGLFILLALLVIMTFVRLWKKRTKTAFLLHGLASLALCWTHPFSILVLASPGIYMLWRGRSNRALFFSWAGLQILIFLPQVLYLSTLHFWPQSTTSQWIAPPSVGALLATLFFQDISAFHWQLKGGAWTELYKTPFLVINLLFAFFILYLLLLFLKEHWKKGDDKEFKGRGGLLFLWILLPPMALFMASWFFRPCMFPRYTAHGMIPLFLCLAYGATRARSKLMPLIYSFVLLVGMGFQWAWTQPGPQRTDWRGAAQLVAEKSAPEDFILVNEFLWRDVFQHNAETTGGIAFSQPVISADNEALLAAQALLCLSFPAHENGAVWAVLAGDYFDDSVPNAFENCLQESHLLFTHWHFPAIRDIYVYRITSPEKPSLDSVQDFQNSYHRCTMDEKGEENFLSHEAMAALSDLAMQCALHGRSEEAHHLLEELSLRNSFAREFYPNLLRALRDGQAIETQIEALQWLWKGYGARENGQHRYALQCFVRASEKDATLAIAHLEVAYELFSMKDHARAVEALRAARNYNSHYGAMTDSLMEAFESGTAISDHSEALFSYRKASLSMERGELEEAEKLLLEAVALDDRLAPAHLLLAFLFTVNEETGQSDKHLEEYRVLSDKKEDEVLAHLALIQAEQRQTTLCRKTLERLFALAPESRKVYGSLYEACEDEEQAFLSAASIRALWQGYDAHAFGDTLEGGRSFEKALQLDPNNTLAGLEWGLCLVEEERYEEALPVLRMAAERDSDYGRMLSSLISGLERGESLAGKLNALRIFRRGILAQSQHDYEEAVTLLQEALLLDPELTEGHTSLAFLLVTQNNYDEAEAVLQVYLSQVEIGVPGAYGLLAVVAFAKGELSAALEAVAEAERIDPAYGEEFGPFFRALLQGASYEALMAEITLLKEKGVDLEILLGDLIEERFPR